MSKKVKELGAKEYCENYRGVKNSLFVNYHGLAVNQAVQLQNWLKSEEIQMNVLKNSTARLAFKELGFSDADQFITGPVAFIYSKPGGKSDNPITLTKCVRAWQIKYPGSHGAGLKIQGGYAEGRAISEAEAKELAKSLTPQEMKTQLVWLLAQPMAGLARGLNAIMQRFALVVKALTEKPVSPSGSGSGGENQPGSGPVPIPEGNREG